MSNLHGRHTQPHLGACAECGKQRYRSRTAARKAARRLYPGEALRAYQCGEYWHIGHTPQWKLRGEG